MSGVDLDAGCQDALAELARLSVWAQIGNHHLHARITQIEGDGVGVGIARQHDAALAGFDGVKTHQTLGRRAEHHTRQVVVAEDGGLFDAAGGDQGGPGAEFGQPVRVDECDPPVGIIPGSLRAEAQLQVFQPAGLGQQVVP